jgi:hypothetical protein
MIWPLKKKSMRGQGWLRDIPDIRDMHYYQTPRTPDPAPSVDLSEHVIEILDQGDAGSCVAHAYAYAIMIAESQAKLPYDPISREYLYFNARALTGDERQDSGTYLRSAAKALQVMGAAPETVWPYKMAMLNTQPSMQAHMLAHPRRGGAYRRIGGTGPARCNSIRRAIEAGHAVTFGASIPQRFMDYQGGVIDVPTDADTIVGGHALCIVGYDATGFRFVNSWTDSWGESGFAWISPEYLGSTYADDFWIVSGWQRLRDAFEPGGVAA